MRYSAALVLGASIVAAAPAAQGADTTGFTAPVVAPSRGGRAVCVSGSFPVNVTSTKNVKFNFDVPKNQTGVTQTFVSLVTPGSPFAKQIFGSQQTVSGTYKIAGSLCMPANHTTTRASSVQFLTHGVGFDRTYWDFAPGYSYVDAAADNGVATFLYDRLGVGQSEKPADALNVVQGPVEVEIANELAKQVRRGVFGGKTFQHIVGVGHSYGSLITESVTAQYPASLDAAILTGFSTNSSGQATFLTGLGLGIASQIRPKQFSSLDDGYLIVGGPTGQQTGFFHFPGFEASIFDKSVAEAQTATYGEFFTQNQLIMQASGFKGPVAVVNGHEDLPFCFGNCTYPANKGQEAITMLYPQANKTGTYYGQNSGHGLNLHYSAKDAFCWIQNFIKSSGL